MPKSAGGRFLFILLSYFEYWGQLLMSLIGQLKYNCPEIIFLCEPRLLLLCTILPICLPNQTVNFNRKDQILKFIHSLNKWEVDIVPGAAVQSGTKQARFSSASEQGSPSPFCTMHCWRWKECNSKQREIPALVSSLFCVRELKCGRYSTWSLTLGSSICISGFTSKQCEVLKKEKKYELMEIQCNASLDHGELDRSQRFGRIQNQRRGQPRSSGRHHSFNPLKPDKNCPNNFLT